MRAVSVGLTFQVAPVADDRRVPRLDRLIGAGKPEVRPCVGGGEHDGCRDLVTGALHPEAQRIVEAFGSNAEVSPSKRGVKIFARGRLPAAVGHSQHPTAPFTVEMYATGRYFTVTGQQLPSTPNDVCDAQVAIDALYLVMRPPVPPKPVQPRSALRLSPGEAGAERATLAEVRERFNAEHSIESLIAEDGAVAVPGGYTCPYCPHTHTVTLYISKGGRLFSYSPRCRLHTTKGWDAFGLFAELRHTGDLVAALKSLNPLAARQASHEPAQRSPEYLNAGRGQAASGGRT